MTLETELVFVKRCHKGEGVSYGHTYYTEEGEWIGTVPVGYGDGLPRKMQGFEVIVNGEADSTEEDYFHQQLHCWHALTDGLPMPPLVHLANSGAAMYHADEMPTDVIRAGTVVYGVEPSLGELVGSLAWLETAAEYLSPDGPRLQVNLAVDTGMGRIGFRERATLETAITYLKAHDDIFDYQSIMTHFSKANAYGFGLVPMSQAALAGGVDGLAVAVLDEGLALRQAGITAPILVLGITLPQYAKLLADNQVMATSDQLTVR
ncbi:alanine racemase [Weissella confusa]|uniref:Alanine racemase n=1 Tax=Weissella confusa TaxID=1583 RepID=A0A923NK12_WEICO|nr:alanine racemase [Weissella confusa]